MSAEPPPSPAAGLPAGVADEARMRRIRQLTELSRRITGFSEPEPALELAVQTAARLFEGKALLAVRGEAGFVVRAAVGAEGALGALLPHSAIEARLSALMAEPPTRILAVPLVARNEVAGIMVVRTDQAQSHEEEWFLSALADQVAVVWETSRLGDLARQHVHRLDAERQRADERAQLLAREQAARAEAEGLRQRAEEANRMKDEFIATVSHELRTPLNAILGWARLLRAGSLDAASGGRALEIIERNARAQAQLIEDLLDISRITSGKLRLMTSYVDLPAVVSSAIDTARPAADAKGVELRVELSSAVRTVLGDPERLQQIVWNLLSNAVKFTPEGGQVRVSLSLQGPHAELTVADSGQGIAADFLPHVFDRFRQAEGGSARPHSGLGLGLSIVRHLVEAHGGTVEAHSDGLGKGARFTVRLPRANQAVAEPGRAPQAAVPAGRLSGLRVLVVDDEPDARELLQEMLEQEGARVRAAGSCREALAALAEERPDVLVSDIAMPGEDGYTLVQRLRALPAERGGRIPAVALTAYARSEDRTRALRAGFDLHLPKPVEPQELLAALKAVSRFAG